MKLRNDSTNAVDAGVGLEFVKKPHARATVYVQSVKSLLAHGDQPAPEPIQPVQCTNDLRSRAGNASELSESEMNAGLRRRLNGRGDDVLHDGRVHHGSQPDEESKSNADEESKSSGRGIQVRC